METQHKAQPQQVGMKHLSVERSTYDREAKDSSKLTIPSLIPEQTTGTKAKLKTPSKATGSRGVNSLSNKLLMTFFLQAQHFLN